MTNLIDGAFASVGLLSIFVYGGLLANGAPPERALVVALGGGLVVGVLLHFVLLFVQLATEDDEKPSAKKGGASAEALESGTHAADGNAATPAPHVKTDTGGRLQEKAA